MVNVIKSPAIIEAAGNKPKKIEEFFGHVNSQTQEVSIARMTSPQGWVEPAQTPEFNEYTVVLRGKIKVECNAEEYIVEAGQGILTEKGQTVRYSTPFEGGAEYIAVCLPAFSPDRVHRDDD